jgi:ribosome maturation factor RimP
MAGKEAQLRELIKPIVEALSLQLWGVEYQSHGKQAVVRIYIDSPEGVDVDDCANVSRQVGSIFDVEDPVQGEYTLEVSSPGIDRPLFEIDQYQEFAGEDVKLRLRSAFEGRRNFTGRLVGVEEGDVVVAVDEHEYLLPFELIDKAQIIARL